MTVPAFGTRLGLAAGADGKGAENRSLSSETMKKRGEKAESGVCLVPPGVPRDPQGHGPARPASRRSKLRTLEVKLGKSLGKCRLGLQGI